MTVYIGRTGSVWVQREIVVDAGRVKPDIHETILSKTIIYTLEPIVIFCAHGFKGSF